MSNKKLHNRLNPVWHRMLRCFIAVPILQQWALWLTGSPLENWRRPPGRPRTTWMKIIQQDLKSNNLSLSEGIGMTQNRTLWRLTSVYVWRYAPVAVLAIKEVRGYGTDSVVKCDATTHVHQTHTALHLVRNLRHDRPIQLRRSLMN